MTRYFLVADTQNVWATEMKLWMQKILHSNEETPRVVRSMMQDAGITFVPTQNKADYGLMWHIFWAHSGDPRSFNYTPFNIPLDKIIMCYDEPPFEYHVPHYDAHDSYLMWLSLPHVEKHELFTLDPIVFPYPPHTEYDRVREDTRLHSRGVFYRGNKRHKIAGGEKYGRVDLDPARIPLVQGLATAGVPLDLAGAHWGGKDTYINNGDGFGGDWPARKREEWAVTTADFHLCCENSQVDNYVSEKIHHGFQSDLVVLYLGNRQIEEYVPREAFVNLNGYYNSADGTINVEAVVERIRAMTQEEYDSILHAARVWRQQSRLEERHDAARLRLTQLVLNRFREVGAL